MSVLETLANLRTSLARAKDESVATLNHARGQLEAFAKDDTDAHRQGALRRIVEDVDMQRERIEQHCAHAEALALELLEALTVEPEPEPVPEPELPTAPATVDEIPPPAPEPEPMGAPAPPAPSRRRTNVVPPIEAEKTPAESATSEDSESA